MKSRMTKEVYRMYNEMTHTETLETIDINAIVDAQNELLAVDEPYMQIDRPMWFTGRPY